MDGNKELYLEELLHAYFIMCELFGVTPNIAQYDSIFDITGKPVDRDKEQDFTVQFSEHHSFDSDGIGLDYLCAKLLLAKLIDSFTPTEQQILYVLGVYGRTICLEFICKLKGVASNCEGIEDINQILSRIEDRFYNTWVSTPDSKFFTSIVLSKYGVFDADL